VKPLPLSFLYKTFAAVFFEKQNDHTGASKPQFSGGACPWITLAQLPN
jgi:hypothetical protein